MSETTLHGRCLCGAVTITVHRHDPRIGACHCRMCQRWSGGLFLCFDVPADQLSFDGPVTRHASSAIAERAFCARCGSHLWMRDTVDETAEYDVMPGLFDAAQSWPLRSEIYTDQAFASVQLGGDQTRKTRAEYEAKNPHVGEGESL